jgi:hypothetical protein
MAATQAFAADTPPSEDSIRRLMAATDSRKVLDTALATLDSSMDIGIKHALADKPVNARAQKVIDEMRAKMVDVFREGLAWKDMEPLFIQAYQRSLTQDEVNGMLAFYESPAGKAVVRKLPLIMQNTAQLMQERMRAVTPKIAQIQQEALDKIKAAAAE